jgi:hypothetical protein
MLAIRTYLLVDYQTKRGGYARLNSPGTRDATSHLLQMYQRPERRQVKPDSPHTALFVVDPIDT